MKKSHIYDFVAKDFGAILVPTLLPFGLFSLLMHFGALMNLLPKPHPTLDVDRTILFHQAEASRQLHDADVLLSGDSSCLMDVAAVQLGQLLPSGHSALNLGTLSYLDLQSFGGILQCYAATNPNRLRVVVLLMHPEALRRPSASDYHPEALQRFFREKDFCNPASSPVLCALGVEIFRGRLLNRIMPQPLPGAYGRQYGFTRDLWNYLSAQHGSALDPGRFESTKTQGNAEYRLAKSLEVASENFRATVPAGVKLIVGITPVPETLAGLGYQQRHREMLQTWSQWLKADAALTDLPATMSDDLFASSTHLNESGVRIYTDQLAKSLASFLPKAP